MEHDKRDHDVQAYSSNPAKSAAGERSFSTARRSKTWLRSSMTQERFSNLMTLNSHKDRTDRLSLLDIANEFKERNGNRNEILVCLENRSDVQ